MQLARIKQTPATRPTRPFDSPALANALAQGLCTPLEALRVSMESLCSEFHGRDPRLAMVTGSLAEVIRVGANANALMELATDPVPRPLRCTVDEIVYTARLGLDASDRERVWIALDSDERELFLDGPLLSMGLRRLLENALEAGPGEILLHVDSNEGIVTFTVVNGAPGMSFDVESARRAFDTTKPNHIGLGLTLALRDVELVGGGLEIRRTRRGNTWAVILVPAATGEQV